MERERTDGLAGGRSLIGLIITQAEAKPTDYIRKRVRDIINVFVPGNHFITKNEYFIIIFYYCCRFKILRINNCIYNWL